MLSEPILLPNSGEGVSSTCSHSSTGIQIPVLCPARSKAGKLLETMINELQTVPIPQLRQFDFGNQLLETFS